MRPLAQSERQAHAILAETHLPNIVLCQAGKIERPNGSLRRIFQGASFGLIGAGNLSQAVSGSFWVFLERLDFKSS